MLNNDVVEEFFKDKKAYFIYNLLHTDGRTRQDNLGIRRYHYTMRDTADKWYDGIVRCITQGRVHKDQVKALVKLKNMHNAMTSHHDDPSESDGDGEDVSYEDYMTLSEMEEDGLL